MKDVGIAERRKAGKQGKDDINCINEFSIPPCTYLFSLYKEKDTELFYAILPVLFPYFLLAIPTCCYTLLRVATTLWSGSRSYTDLVNTLSRLCLHQPAHIQASFKGCPNNCRRLAYSSFQLIYMAHDDHAVQV